VKTGGPDSNKVDTRDLQTGEAGRVKEQKKRTMNAEQREQVNESISGAFHGGAILRPAETCTSQGKGNRKIKQRKRKEISHGHGVKTGEWANDFLKKVKAERSVGKGSRKGGRRKKNGDKRKKIRSKKEAKPG